MLRWTEGERERLTEQAFVALQNQPGASIPTILNHLQQQMPAGRRRQIRTVNDVPWLPDKLIEMFAAQRHDARQFRERRDAPPAPPPRIPTAEEVLANASLAEIGAIYARRQAEALQAIARDQQVIQTGLARLQARGDPQAGSARPPLPPASGHEGAPLRFVIVGLLRKQECEFDRYASQATMIFFEAHRVPGDLPDATRYFLLTKFIGHRWQFAITDKRKLVLVEGGMSALHAAIARELDALAGVAV